MLELRLAWRLSFNFLGFDLVMKRSPSIEQIIAQVSKLIEVNVRSVKEIRLCHKLSASLHA